MNRLFNASDGHGKIDLVWSNNPPGELVTWSRCYQVSAQTLAKHLLESSVYADRDACPIIFLYRHSLELCLKALLLEAAALCNLEGDAPPFSRNILGSHNLKPLIKPLENVFKRFNWKKNSNINKVQHFDEVLEVVHEFDQLDSKSFAFRYPVDKSFNTALLPHSLGFNMREFVETMDPILETLQQLVHSVNLENDFVYEQQFWENSEEATVDA